MSSDRGRLPQLPAARRGGLALRRHRSGYSHDVTDDQDYRARRCVPVLAISASRARRLLIVLPVIFAALALAAAACSGGGDNGSGQTPAAGRTATGPAPAAATLNVSQGDTFFDPNELVASPGQEVTFNITNAGQAVHNLRIAGPDGEYETEDDAVVAPIGEGGLPPGDTASLQWTAPGQPGVIKFRCDFHPTAMTGTIAVGD